MSKLASYQFLWYISETLQTPRTTTAPPLVAMLSLRLRRALSLSSSILNHHNPLSSSTPALHAPPQISPNELDLLNLPFQSRAFRSSNISLSSRPRTSSYNNEDNKISPDEILFEGCDYNHWLIVMDFSKDPKPSPEEMIETYVQTAAKVLGRSISFLSLYANTEFFGCWFLIF